MTWRDGRCLRWVSGATVLGAVLWWTGTSPFADGVRSIDGQTLALGIAIGVPTTFACAWRWQLVARGLGIRVDLGPAVASCYRAQFLNTTLPGGILGDMHRGVQHGREAGDVRRALRAVVWERTAGQAVLVVVAVLVLLVLPSPLRPSPSTGLTAVAGLATGLFVLALVARRAATSRADSPVRRIAWPGVVLASTVALAGYVATYLVAARAVGVTTSPASLLPLALLVLLAAGLPLNVAGWGPREGMAAWAFAAAGLGAEQGVATAVAYGVMVVVASLPGMVVAVAGQARLPQGGPAHG